MRALVSELVGTALLLAAVVGSGIMGERLAGGNVAVALLANTLATGAALVALILTFGAISGAHFNPAVTFADASQGGLAWRQGPAYSSRSVVGAVTGVAAAQYMFGEPVFRCPGTFARARRRRSAKAWPRSACSRSSGDARRRRAAAVPFAVGAYITAAYWFTASTSFAQPRRHHRAVDDRHLRRDSTHGRSTVRGRPGAGRPAGHGALRMARSARAARGNRDDERVIFACVHNAGRSQMAAAFFSNMADPSRATAMSAGTQPADRVHPEVVTAMREVGIDLGGNQPQLLTDELAQGASLLVTMGCGEACPYVPGLSETTGCSPIRRAARSPRSAPFATTFAGAWRP